MMKSIVLAATLAIGAMAALSPSPSYAAGCLKGAVVGGVAGHYAGNHGVLGAGAGCIIGHHEAAKNARARDDQRYVDPNEHNDGHYHPMP